jgi:SAM-dependent methyltransferase
MFVFATKMQIAINLAVAKAVAATMPARDEAINLAVARTVAETMAETMIACENEVINRTLQIARSEYTVMPRFAFHQPLDYLYDTLPPDFGSPPIFVNGEPLAIPPVGMRGGYPADNAEYLASGSQHYSYYLEQIEKHRGLDRSLSILEFGCATGRVLRHFHRQRSDLNWELMGCDVQSSHIEWLRQNWPQDICVYVGSVFPKLPFEDNSIDIIYGMSVFTHIKYHWDFWLLELRRVLKPRGLLLQTIHAEKAWKFYHSHRHLDWVQTSISPRVLNTPEMDVDFLLSGDISLSQVFFKREVARRYWSRYLRVVEISSPENEYWFQDLIVCRKE